MKLPLTLRLAYHGFRATVRAGLLFLLAWVFLIPASDADTTALGVREGMTYPAGLRMMRVAKIVVAIAPPQAYDVVAAVMRRPDVSPLMVRIAMIQIASGNVLPASTRENEFYTRDSDRDIDGPRFIKVD